MKRLEETARFCVDVDAAVGFYAVLLGQKPQMHQPGEAALFMLDDVKLFLGPVSVSPRSGRTVDRIA